VGENEIRSKHRIPSDDLFTKRSEYDSAIIACKGNNGYGFHSPSRLRYSHAKKTHVVEVIYGLEPTTILSQFTSSVKQFLVLQGFSNA